VKPKLKKTLIILFASILSLVVVIILFISPITKYLIEKYDEKLIGRQVKMDWAFVNPLSGYIYLSGIKFYESKSDSIFISTKGLGLNFSIYKLFFKEYEITELTLHEPVATFIQNKTKFNFDDIVDKVTPDKKDTLKEETRFSLLNITIKDGEFHYREEVIPVTYFIKKANFTSAGMSWDVDTMVVDFSFLSGPATGSIKGSFTLNTKSMKYRLAAVADKYDLKFLEQYIADMSNYGSLSANLDADMLSIGDFKDALNVTTKGKLIINDFHFGKDPKEDYLSFEKLAISIHEVSPNKRMYYYDSISLVHPYFKYEKYDSLDNLQKMFGSKGSNINAATSDPEKFNLLIEIARYVKVLATNFFKSNYKVNRIAVYDADLKYNDYSISEKFSVSLDPLNITADSIHKTKDRVKIKLTSGVKPYGSILVNVSINPKDSSDFNLRYHFDKVPLAMFNPYIISYTSFSLDRGAMEFKGNWNVKNGIIDSDNHLLIIDPRANKRIRNKDTKWIPVPLVMAFVRERGDVIDYEIPITGNLKDPKFKLRDVILDLLKNIFIKPPTTPYRIQVKANENEIEKSLAFKWAMRQNTLLKEQEKFAERMSYFLEDNPGASLSIYPQTYAVKEKEYILLFEAKKKYYLSNHKKDGFGENDSLEVDKLSAKDPLFSKYLNKQVPDSMLFTVQDKCLRLVGNMLLQTRLGQLTKEREQAFMIYFKEKKVDGRIKFHASENVTPYNGFSFYKIDYKGEIPDYLQKAHQKMNEFDDESPRKKYKKERLKKKTAVQYK